MAIPIGYAEVTAHLTNPSLIRPMACVWGVLAGDPFTQADANAISAAAGTFYRALMSLDYSYAGVTVAVGNDGGPIYYESTSGVGLGAGPTPGCSPNVAMLMRKSTQLGGRHGRGRMYIPGPQESTVSSAGVLTPAMLTALNTQGAALLTALAANGTDMVLLSNVPLGDPQPTVTSLVGQNIAATQRRRLRS